MKRYLLLILASAFVSVTTLVGQNKFRIQEWQGVGEFIVPPKSKLVNSEGELRDCSKYHYVKIDSLTNKYSDYKEALSKAVYKRRSKSIISNSTAYYADDNPDDGFYRFQISQHESKSYSVLEIELAFEDLRNNKTDLFNNFQNLGDNLVKFVSKFENLHLNPQSGQKNTDALFDSGLARLVWEEVYNSIPVPVDAATCRYLQKKDPEYSVLLLNPEITLQVDLAERVLPDPRDQEEFNFVWLGRAYFSFQYNGDGQIVQNVFTDQQTPLSNNAFGGSVLLASGVGIQNSSSLYQLPYITLIHKRLKRNSSSGTSSGQIYDADPFKQNAYLIHSKLLPIDARNHPNVSENLVKSFFGKRNSISPMIRLYVNKQQISRQLGLRLLDLKGVPNKFKIRRLFKGKYKRIRHGNRNLYLMPNDHITFRL